MKKFRLYIKSLLAAFLIFSVFGCEKIMEVDLADALNGDDHYSYNGEVYGAFFGISSAFTKVAEQVIILGELKGDLMQPTINAPDEYWNIYRYTADNSTTYTNPSLFYDIVINCNDFIKRAVKYNIDYPGDIPEDAYKGMVAQAICYKTWSLMMIAQFWGEAQVYDDPLLTDDEQVMVTLGWNSLPDFLINYMLGGVEGVNAFHDIPWATLLDSEDANWAGCTMEPNVLVGELSLWAGNYQQAFDYFMKGIARDANNLHPLTTSYFSIFEIDPTQAFTEILTAAVFKNDYHQTHNLGIYFGQKENRYANLYYFAPTSVIVDLYDSQLTSNYANGDLTRRLVAYSIWTSWTGGSSTETTYSITKYGTSLECPIPIYRAGQIFLNIIEALAFMGRYDEALGLLNDGLKASWNGSAYDPPFTDYPADLKASFGVRSRSSLLEIKGSEIFADATTSRDSLVNFLGVVADEIAMELAFEGKRWPSLVRMARNLNMPAFLADRVSAKFGEEAAYYHGILMQPENWFIKDDKTHTLKQ